MGETSTFTGKKLTARQHSAVFNYSGIVDCVFKDYGTQLSLYLNNTTGEISVGTGLFSVGSRIGEITTTTIPVIAAANDYFFVVMNYDASLANPVYLEIIVQQSSSLSLVQNDTQINPTGKRQVAIYTGRYVGGIFTTLTDTRNLTNLKTSLDNANTAISQLQTDLANKSEWVLLYQNSTGLTATTVGGNSTPVTFNVANTNLCLEKYEFLYFSQDFSLRYNGGWLLCDDRGTSAYYQFDSDGRIFSASTAAVIGYVASQCYKTTQNETSLNYTLNFARRKFENFGTNAVTAGSMIDIPIKSIWGKNKRY